MPRASRHFLAGHVWHITQRCHQREFLLKFARDRRRWRHWLFEAKRRYGLQVLNYQVLSNHVHLLVREQGKGEIVASMQLVSGRTAQEYNRRKSRQGAFWQDRYHATAVQTDEHLWQCLLYIDLNIVRAGAVPHPGNWVDSSYHELLRNSRKFRTTHLDALLDLLGMATVEQLMQVRNEALHQAIARKDLKRDPKWTESVAVGTNRYVEGVRAHFSAKALERHCADVNGSWVLSEPSPHHEAVSRPYLDTRQEA